MKKSYSVLTLTCLVMVFTMVLTPGYAQSKTAIPPTSPAVDVNPVDLPEKFNQLKVGMTEDQVKQLLGYPVTIIPTGNNKREWKYYFPGGVARLYLNFQDNKIVSIQKRTP